MLNGAVYDLDSVEVLKGPQGTLFGRNTEGGALNITTKKPTGKFGLSVTDGVGNYGSYESEVHLNLPEYHDFSLKVDGLITSRSGTVHNTYPSASDFNGFDRRGVRAQLQWRPAPNFTVLYAYDNVYDASTVGYMQRVKAGTAGYQPTQAVQANRADQVDYGVPLQPSIGHQNGHTLTLKWDVTPHLTLKSISSYRELIQSQWDDGGLNGSAFVQVAMATSVAATDNKDARNSLANFDQYQYSEQIQAIGDIGRVKFVVGSLAYREYVRDQAQAFNTGYFNSAGTLIIDLPGPGNLMNNYGLPITNVVMPLGRPCQRCADDQLRRVRSGDLDAGADQGPLAPHRRPALDQRRSAGSKPN